MKAIILMMAAAAGLAPAFAGDALEARMDKAWRTLMDVKWSAKTGLICGTRPSEVKPACEFTDGLYRWSKENKDGYGRGMTDGAIVNGVSLAMLCDRYAVTKDEAVKADAAKVAKGLVSLATLHGRRGFVARGICEEDGRSICALSSVDQVTHWYHGLWRYQAAGLATPEERATIARLFTEVAERITREATAENGYRFRQADGEPDPRGICSVWDALPPKERKSVHGATRLPMIYLATFDLTGDRKWKDLYEKYVDTALEVNLRLRDEDPKQWRWNMPTYSILQMNSANEVIYLLERDPRRRELVAECMRAGAKVADGRQKDMIADPSRKWYGMCPEGELALAMLLAPGFDYDATERGFIAARLAKVDPSRPETLNVSHFVGAYWRLRRNTSAEGAPCAKGMK